MKAIFTSFLLFICTCLLAQTPQAINYQAVARDGANNLLVSRNIGIRISILASSSTGTNVYTETHATTTNASGIFSVEIGRGTVVSGDFPNIQWNAYPHFAKIEIDANGGNNYQLVGTSQFLSVPYALFAENTAMIFRLGNNFSSDTIVMYRGETTDINKNYCLEWIGGESENLTVTASGFNSKIYPIGTPFPNVITSTQFESNDYICNDYSLHVDTSTLVGIYPITISASNSRGRSKTKTTFLQIKNCPFLNESAYAVRDTVQLSFYIDALQPGFESIKDSIVLSNGISNDNKINIYSRIFNLNNIELTYNGSSYAKENFAVNNFTLPYTFGNMVVQNPVISVYVSGVCTSPNQNQIAVRFNIISGTTNIVSPLNLSNLSGLNANLRGILTR